MPCNPAIQRIAPALGDAFHAACRFIGGTSAQPRITRQQFADTYGTARGIMFVSGRGREARVFFSFETPCGPVKASAENAAGTRWAIEYPAPSRKVRAGQRMTEAEAIAEISRTAAGLRLHAKARNA